ncbi:Ubiquitin family protein [Schizosaccharomyces pombe]|uniref:Uncharacterized protein PB2B4.07 n=1 Tax=Schizosaccharomyces pombe (strain 972 / ATCC 24843) TaxID=284812 RepID=YFW7_SCHPO|nr:ubiquitin UBTD1 family protein [Schizosaccharomyces pombe]Q9HDW4.1 RecName: Full=Uncharacterized protein PB2B4.07 [Schizosaccharomyces pombe 972h-]CAC21473.1 ubiquitin family protein, human UBTD1 homolog [Schizosaccharomyces pombe]|eukprot:NP_593893.1 ubiquitin UBTD1 family protein [Schizosaccharomyces pombe]
MGQCLSGNQVAGVANNGGEQPSGSNILRLPKLYTPNPLLTKEEVEVRRNEFWETCWAYGGSKEIWDVLHKVVTLLYEGNAEAATEMALAADLTIPENDISKGVYDSKGTFYEIPKIVARIPRAFAERKDSLDDEDDNMISSNDPTKSPEEHDTTTKSIASLKDAELDSSLETVLIRYSKDDKDYSIQINPNLPFSHAKSQLEEVGLENVQRFFFLGRVLQFKKSLSQQGWTSGMIIQAM